MKSLAIWSSYGVMGVWEDSWQKNMGAWIGYMDILSF
jgi:hypothetical protein